ncbi:MAG: family 2A encapsulin nanocompartment cargo protein cysteine desulfurase [Hyphomicrobiaceae bacterium]|nr:family 2A encapsulin nanocompartment cargo protein cysteine desulfurase [Hyphomicrobiaceae bacterium]
MSTADPTALGHASGIPVTPTPSVVGIGLSPQGLGLPDAALLTRLANELFSTVPGSPLGSGATALAPQPQAHDLALAPEVPPEATTHSAGGVGLSSVPLPQAGDLNGGHAPTGPGPSMELVPDVPLGSPPSAGTVATGSPIPLPFEAELKSLLGTLGGETRIAPAPLAEHGSGFYFLKNIGLGPAGIGVPGHAATGASPGFASAHPPFDVHSIRRDFPILSEHVNGHPLIWFDNAATTQKPKAVIDRLTHFYEHENSNIHRAAHELAARSTDAYEGARQKVARFLTAGSTEEIIFTRGATEAINLVAATFGAQHVNASDEIVITHLEHHANIVPWQQLALAKGAKLRVAPVDDHGQVLLEELGKLLNARTKLVAFTQVSNALGTVTPAKEIIDMAHRVGARVLIDGAQSVSHMKVDVQSLGADFFVFSGHKVFAPTGIGVLWGKKELLDSLPPYQTGGNMIRDVTFERSLFHAAPQRFEAGTGNIADAVGLGAAIDYVERIGLENISRYEHGLLVYATKSLLEIPGLRIIGTATEKAGVISLVLKNVPSEEVGARLNKYGIAVRSGHHCAQPILRRFGQETTVRPSFAFYNTCGEIDVLADALRDIASTHGLAD